MVDTFLDVAADSPVPALSGTHSISLYLNICCYMKGSIFWSLRIKSDTKRVHDWDMMMEKKKKKQNKNKTKQNLASIVQKIQTCHMTWKWKWIQINE